MNRSKHGTLAVFVAKLVFLVAGYALYISLGRLLTTEEFGLYGVIFGVIALINMVLINGTMQTISRFVALNPDQGFAVRKKAFAYQAVFAGVVLSSFLLAAPLIGDFLNDASLVPYLRAATSITVIYAFYAINVGYLNGTQQFVKQASLDIAFSICKVGLIVLLVYLNYSIYGIIAGFATAAFLVFLLSWVLVGRSTGVKSEVDFSSKSFISFAFGVLGVAILLNLVMNSDLFLLKRLSPTDVADTNTGYYTAAQSIARIPYYLLVTASLILFPAIANMDSEDGKNLNRQAAISSQAITMTFALVAGMAALTIPLGEQVVTVLFPDRYIPAGEIFSWLIGGLCLLALVNICISILSGGGKPAWSAGILAVCLTTQFVAINVLMPKYGVHGAAMGTTIAGAIAFLFCLGLLYYRYGTRLSLHTIVVVAVSSGISLFFAQVYHDNFPNAGKIVTVLFLAVSYLCYLGFLFMGGVLVGLPDKRKKVLLVTKPLDPPYNDGAKVFPRQLVDHLQGDDCAVCCTKSIPRDEAWPQDVHVYGVYSSSGTFAGRNLQNLRMFLFLFLHRFHFKTLHFFFAPNPLASTAVRWLRIASPGVQFVQTVLSRPESFENVNSLLFGDIVTTSSKHTMETLKAHSKNQEIQLVRSGIESNSPPRNREECLRTMGLSTTHKHILFAGDIDSGGALGHLANIVPAVLSENENTCFHFSVRRKTSNSEDIAKSFFQKHLEVFGSRAKMYIDFEQFPDLILIQDAMLIPAENLHTKMDAPLVILETMRAGKPFFGLDVAPINEIPPAQLRDKLLASSDEELARLILNYLNDSSIISSDALKERIREEFDIKNTAQAFRSIYEHR